MSIGPPELVLSLADVAARGKRKGQEEGIGPRAAMLERARVPRDRIPHRVPTRRGQYCSHERVRQGKACPTAHVVHRSHSSPTTHTPSLPDLAHRAIYCCASSPPCDTPVEGFFSALHIP